MKWLHSKKGFTLIELMIVILIIAILVAIAVPVYLAATTSAKRRTCQSNLRTIDSAINAYNGFYDAFPPAAVAPGLACHSVLGETWLKRDPTCPSMATAAQGTYALTTGTGAAPTTKCPVPVLDHTI